MPLMVVGPVLGCEPAPVADTRGRGGVFELAEPLAMANPPTVSPTASTPIAALPVGDLSQPRDSDVRLVASRGWISSDWAVTLPSASASGARSGTAAIMGVAEDWLAFVGSDHA